MSRRLPCQHTANPVTRETEQQLTARWKRERVERERQAAEQDPTVLLEIQNRGRRLARSGRLRLTLAE